MWLKRKIAPAMYWAANLSGYSLRRIRGTPGARILMYHGVGGSDCTTRVFRKQIEFLRREFDVVSLAVMTENLEKQHPDLHNQVALTFDDGLRNNLTYAYPILKKYNAPATFFICPGLINGGRWLWTVEMRARLRRMNPLAYARLSDSLGRPGQSLNQVVGWMKTLPTRSRLHVEEIIRDATPTWHPKRKQEVANNLMTWDEIKSLDPKLITIGAHSTNHPILANCSRDELEHEVVECQSIIQKHILKPVNFFCYPNGDFNPDVTEFVQRAYRSSVITKPGIITEEVKLHQIPRLGTTANMHHFKWRMHRPSS